MVAKAESVAGPKATDFHRVITERADRWYSACLRITQDRQLAEDAVQDGLLNAWRKRHQFNAGARLDTWIHRITVNAALQLLRRQKPQRQVPLDAAVLASDATPEVHQQEIELASDLNRALAKLSDMERLCFVLKHLEQWRLREIADELDVSIGTVKQALFRGVKKLRQTMPDPRNPR